MGKRNKTNLVNNWKNIYGRKRSNIEKNSKYLQNTSDSENSDDEENDLKNKDDQKRKPTSDLDINKIKVVENYFEDPEKTKLNEDLEIFEENFKKIFYFLKNKYWVLSDIVKKDFLSKLIDPLINVIGKKGLKIVLTLLSSSTQKSFLLFNFHYFIPYKICRFFYIILNGFWSYNVSKNNIPKFCSIILAYLDYINYFN